MFTFAAEHTAQVQLPNFSPSGRFSFNWGAHGMVNLSKSTPPGSDTLVWSCEDGHFGEIKWVKA